jgi:AcrR family transcriptional regulator
VGRLGLEVNLSPRGKPIPTVDEMLFEAAERILARIGPSGITSRAITDEAGCAKGVLHNHFGDLDGFLAAFVMDRSARLAHKARLLIPLAGQGSVVDNLTNATVDLFGSSALVISGLVISRPEVAQRIRQQHAGAAPVLKDIEDAIRAYLQAEMRLGRLRDGTDTATLAFAAFASAHQLFLTGGGQRISKQRMRRVLHTLLVAATPAP